MMTVSLFETLDQYEIQFIADFMSPLSQIIVRATCPYGEKVIAISEKTTLMDMIRGAAVNGHRDLCVLAHEWLGVNVDVNRGIMYFLEMLFNAVDCKDPARGWEICQLARQWMKSMQ